MAPCVLVAGIGNIFLGDDAFGVEVARRMAFCGLPEGARVVDFGIRGLDLAYALLDGYETVILVDAVPRGGPPGTLYVMELPLGEPAGEGGGVLVEAHQLDPVRVLGLAASMGARVGRMILVGCEPTPLDEATDFGAELSTSVRAAVDEAIPLIERLVRQFLQGETAGSAGINTIIGQEFKPCWD